MINQSLSFPFYKMGGSSCLVSAKQMLQPGKKVQWPLLCVRAACGFSKEIPPWKLRFHPI